MVKTPGVWILRTRAQDPCSCCCRPGVGLRPAADHPQMVTTPGVLDPADPGARSLQLLLQTWCGFAPRRGPSANGYDAWRFGSCGPGRKILAAAAADLVWVCAPPRTIRKWLRRLVFWILRTRAQDPCSCCLIIINDTLARSLEPVVTECKEHTIHTQTQIVASRKPKEIKHTHEGEANFT